MADPAPSPKPRPRSFLRRALRFALLILVVLFLVRRFVPRPGFLPLASHVDGPPLKSAAGVVVFLHGRGGSLFRARSVAKELRAAGLPPDISILLVEGPYSTWWGHKWGDTPESQAESRKRLRALLHKLLGESGAKAGRLVIAGFSQGAGVALDMAVEEPRVDAVASFSPCMSMLRGELPAREGLRTLLVHGRTDPVCPVEESRSLARVLESAHRPVRYIEVDGGHTVSPDAIRALVQLATGAPDP